MAMKIKINSKYRPFVSLS